MRVLLVDDQPLFLEGLSNLLTARGIEIVGRAGDGLEALEKARQLQPDVILMDIKMPRCNGLDGTRLIKAAMPDVKILILTVSAADDDLFEAVKCGASGYLLKNMDAGEFFEVIAALCQGEAPLSTRMAVKILEEFTGPRAPKAETDANPAALTVDQVEVLTLIAQGQTPQEVATALGLDERAVKSQIAEVLERLHLRHRAWTVDYLRRGGFIKAK